jgi:hypothetical protein
MGLGIAFRSRCGFRAFDAAPVRASTITVVDSVQVAGRRIDVWQWVVYLRLDVSG